MDIARTPVAPHTPAVRPRPGRLVRWGVPVAVAVGLIGFATAGYVLLRPPAPVALVEKLDPGRFGGIEVGAKGVKPLVIDFQKGGDGYDFDVVSADDKELKEANTDLGALKPGDKAFDPARLEATVKAVEGFRRRLADHYKLPPERISVVVSSGVFSGFAADAAGPARAELTKALAAGDRPPAFITAAQEAEYAARGIIAPSRRDRALLVDIGSGNTKVGHFQPGGFKAFSVEYGTARLQREAAKKAGDAKRPYPDVLAELRESLVAKPLREKMAADPDAGKKTEAHLVGGAVWAMTTYARPAAVRDTRVTLVPEDLTRFLELAALPPADARKKVLDPVADAAVREAAGAEVDRVQKVFAPEQLAAGGALLRSVVDECKLADKTMIFFRKSQYAWIAGYLIEVAGLKD